MNNLKFYYAKESILHVALVAQNNEGIMEYSNFLKENGQDDIVEVVNDMLEKERKSGFVNFAPLNDFIHSEVARNRFRLLKPFSSLKLIFPDGTLKDEDSHLSVLSVAERDKAFEIGMGNVKFSNQIAVLKKTIPFVGGVSFGMDGNNFTIYNKI